MSQKLRVCFLVPQYSSQPPLGGVGMYTRDTARWLANCGHDVHVFCVTRQRKVEYENDGGVHVSFISPHRIRPRSLLKFASRLPGLASLYDVYAGWDLLENSLGGWLKVWECTLKSRFDVIECIDFGGLAFWGLLSPLKSRILLRGHGCLSFQHRQVLGAGYWFHDALERFCVHRASCTLTVSQELARFYQDEFGVDASRVIALPWGIDGPEILRRAATSSLVSRWVESDTILYVGRIEYQKGSDLLFKVLRQVHAKRPQTRAIMVGQVFQDVEAEYTVFMQECATWCWHPGELPWADVLSLMTQSSIIFLPSRTESLGRVLVEAQFCGLPQVATRVGGIPEVVLDGITGFLVDIQKPNLLVEALLKLLSSPELRAEMGIRSRERATTLFEMEQVMDRQVQLYQVIAEGQ